MFLTPLPTFRNLKEYVLMLMPSTIKTKCLTSKLLKQGYQHHKLCKVFFLNCISDTQS